MYSDNNRLKELPEDSTRKAISELLNYNFLRYFYS